MFYRFQYEFSKSLEKQELFTFSFLPFMTNVMRVSRYFPARTIQGLYGQPLRDSAACSLQPDFPFAMGYCIVICKNNL